VRVGGWGRDRPGYDLPGLVVGSEGTLAFATRICVRLLPIQESVRTLLAIFDTVEQASETVSAIIAEGLIPAALEMIDHPTIQAVEPAFHVGIPLDAGAALLIEVDGLREFIREAAALIDVSPLYKYRVSGRDALRLVDRLITRDATKLKVGQVVNVSACASCAGEGRILRNPCGECRGQGRVERKRRLRVRIPAGVDTGSQIRLNGEGEAGFRSGAPGDLYIVLRVKPHPQLERRDQDMVYELGVNIVQAALGDRIEVPTVDGPVEVTIPPGTQYGQTFRLAGKGMPHVRTGRRGDQFVVVQVVVPKDLSAEQRTLLRKVGGQTGQPEKVSKGFFEKLRDAINLD